MRIRRMLLPQPKWPVHSLTKENNVNITIIQQNQKTLIQGTVGEPLTAALLRADFYVSAPCGGRGTCGKCRVWLMHGSSREEVLACQTLLKDEDYTVELSDVSHGQTAFSLENAEAPVHPEDGFGLAVDIGTTTVETALVSLESGRVVDYTSALNPQKVYGADVISRIAASVQPEAICDMQRLILETVGRLGSDLLKRQGLMRAGRMVIVGNTTMLHLFRGVDPTPIGRVPFTPVFTDAVRIDPAKEKAFEILRADEIILLPSVSAYIGADIAADVVELGLMRQDKNVLLADLGTNGEMVLQKGKEFFCTSTAAGPALEGANIECGTGGVEGAVSALQSLDPLQFTTIGNKEPSGICGSGLIDLTALLLEKGDIDENGALSADRIDLAPGVFLSQKDVRQIQLAKSAIRTGLEMLLEAAGLSEEELDRFYILGGLGTHLDPVSAQRAGFFSETLQAKLYEGGNGSLKGACRILANPQRLCEAEDFKQRAVVIELGNNPDFNDRFVDNLFFE